MAMWAPLRPFCFTHEMARLFRPVKEGSQITESSWKSSVLSPRKSETS